MIPDIFASSQNVMLCVCSCYMCVCVHSTFGDFLTSFSESSCNYLNGGCQHDCIQETDSRTCACYQGYQLDGNGHSCHGTFDLFKLSHFEMDTFANLPLFEVYTPYK